MKGLIAVRKYYYNSVDVMDILGCGRARALKVIKQLNVELDKKGYIVENYKIPIKYFQERMGIETPEVESGRS